MSLRDADAVAPHEDVQVAVAVDVACHGAVGRLSGRRGECAGVEIKATVPATPEELVGHRVAGVAVAHEEIHDGVPVVVGEKFRVCGGVEHVHTRVLDRCEDP